MEIVDLVEVNASARQQEGTLELEAGDCLELIRALQSYEEGREDINADEEDFITSLENELCADVVAQEFAREVDRIMPLDGPEAPAFFEALGAWSGRKKKEASH